VKFAAACAMYLLFAIYLYKPYFRHLHDLRNVVVANLALAALGCYLITRRWVWSFTGSFFAGALYGFGPYTLGLIRYHPAAGILVAAVPWLFTPAVFGFKRRRTWLRIPLALLPFLVIVLLFQVACKWRLFAVPNQICLGVDDLLGLFAPLVAIGCVRTGDASGMLIGFYHVPLAALVVGLSMLLAARRIGIITLALVALALSTCRAFLEVSPVIWLSIAVLCGSALVGAGVQGLLLAGRSDRGLLIFTTIIMALLAIVTLSLATKYFQTFLGLAWGPAKLFTQAGQMFTLGTAAVGLIFVTARLQLRAVPIRLIVLCTALGLDVFLGARFIIDAIL
jgi:hypothetical protein